MLYFINMKTTNFEGVCKGCHKSFTGYVRPSWRAKGREPVYCSVQCSNRARNVKPLIKVECGWCGNSVVRRPSKLKQSRSGLFFCNRQCKERAQADLNNPKFDVIRPHHYGKGNGKNDYRKRAFEFYPPHCHVCGYAKLSVLVIHHIDQNRENNSLENLIPVCRNCHKEIHLGITKLEI